MKIEFSSQGRDPFVLTINMATVTSHAYQQYVST